MSYRTLYPGDAGAYFFGHSNLNPRFAFDTMGGHYSVLCFFGSATHPQTQEFFSALESLRYLFDDDTACFFGVSSDPADVDRLPDSLPGIRYFYDTDLHISQLYGAAEEQQPSRANYRRQSIVLDERLRIVRVIPWQENAALHAQEIAQVLQSLPAFEGTHLAGTPAPVLVVPRVFKPSFCKSLIDYYEARGGKESGFMREVDGKTVVVVDNDHKRRRDEEIDDESMRRACMVRLYDRLVPEIRKAFQFNPTRIERYVVACYEAATAGHFRPHRDNSTKGTAHRRFAVSLNLNTGEYDGGELRFPEFGRQRYLPPAGGAVVFSCSLLHEATPVTRGRRFAFLPFLYDDAAAKIREQNMQFVEHSSHPK